MSHDKHHHHHHHNHKMSPKAAAAMRSMAILEATAMGAAVAKDPETKAKLETLRDNAITELKEISNQVGKEQTLKDATKAEDQIQSKLNKERAKGIQEETNNKNITPEERNAHIAEKNNTYDELSKLAKEGQTFIKAKVESGDICRLTKFQTTKIIYKYAQYVSKDSTVIGLAQKMESIADHDYISALKHAQKKKLEKKQHKLSNQLFTIAKVAALGGTLVFAPYLAAALPVISGLGLTGVALTSAVLSATADAICQGAAMQLGLQKEFSFNELFETGVGSGVGAGVAGYGVAVRALTTGATAAMAQGAEVAAGTREDMDPKAIAMQSAAVLTAGAVNEAMKYINTAIENAIPEVVAAAGKENIEIVTNGAASTVANAAENKIAYCNSGDIGEAIATGIVGSIVGNKLGNAAGNAISKQPINSGITQSENKKTDSLEESENKPEIGDMCRIEESSYDLGLPNNEELEASFRNINEVYEILDSLSTSLPLEKTSNDAKFDVIKGVDAFNKGVEITTNGIQVAIAHPIDTAVNLATNVWDGYNAITDATLGISTEGSRVRNAERGKQINQIIDNGDIYTGIEAGAAIISGALLTGGASSSLKAIGKLSFFNKGNPNSLNVIEFENKVYHTVTSPQSAEGILENINPEFFNPDSRFGEAFYLAEIPETTLAELAHHDAVGVNTIRFQFEGDSAKILDLTKPEIAKKWGYLRGTEYPEAQALAKKAQQAGFNVIRYPSERGNGSNLAVFTDFENLLKPQMIVPTPKLEAEIISPQPRLQP